MASYVQRHHSRDWTQIIRHFKYRKQPTGEIFLVGQSALAERTGYRGGPAEPLGRRSSAHHTHPPTHTNGFNVQQQDTQALNYPPSPTMHLSYRQIAPMTFGCVGVRGYKEGRSRRHSGTRRILFITISTAHVHNRGQTIYVQYSLLTMSENRET